MGSLSVMGGQDPRGIVAVTPKDVVWGHGAAALCCGVKCGEKGLLSQRGGENQHFAGSGKRPQVLSGQTPTAGLATRTCQKAKPFLFSVFPP